MGVVVTDTSSYYGVAVGFAPVNELPTIAEMQQTQSGMPLYAPVYHYQGAANNEALASTFSDVAQTEFNVTGAGSTVGVISDSVNQYNGGLSESYGTGDLSSANPVDVLADGPSGSTDEGRAMLENIHDIAPGANLAFDTAAGGDLAMSQSVTALANTAKANIIVDDVSFPDEPLFQDGYISQSINTVTGQGVTYFSAAGNQANGGYLSNWRSASGTVTGIGTGTFENFNPNGGTLLELPITTTNANIPLVMQFDQPYNFQEPTGDPNVDTSTVNFYLLNSSGTVVASSTNNDVAFDAPFQMLTTPGAGNYFIAMELVSGAAPGHVEFYDADDTNELQVDTQATYGSAGGTYYPTSAGHETAVNTIGVGATPWWAPAPFLGQNPLASEPFSSNGPGLYDLTPLGAAMTPVLSLDPAVTAPDGGNTSFFSPGNVINTSNVPPFATGEPSTSTNLSQNLPSFFGTSSAAPNAAAVAALMLQEVPGLTPAEIRAGLIASAEPTPLNGSASGTWDAEGGYGLINAVKAISAVDLLRVSSTNPSNGETVAVTPSDITVTFNKPVNFSTVLASDLTFTTMPTGVTVNVGTPIAVDNPTDPTIIEWPFSFTKPVGTLANGSYAFSIQSPASKTVVSEDGKDLVASGIINFTLADTTAPVVTGTKLSGRTVHDHVQRGTRPFDGHAPEHLCDPQGERDDVAAFGV